MLHQIVVFTPSPLSACCVTKLPCRSVPPLLMVEALAMHAQDTYSLGATISA